MSWIQLNGEVWPVTPDEAELRVHVLAANVNCPRVIWWLEASQYPNRDNPPTVGERWLDIGLDHLLLNVRDWRKLAGLEIRADSAWYATQEFIGPTSFCDNLPQVKVTETVLTPPAGGGNPDSESKEWLAHDFVLRLGKRDGWSFPLELDAWLIPEADYWRETAETAEETARFGEGPPNFRIVTRITFVTGEVELTRAAASDPVAAAREILREQLAFEELHKPEVNWHLRHESDYEKIVPMPGWRSRVFFYTPPERLL